MSRASYRTSHADAGYSLIYDRAYADGYYALQWERVEQPMLRTLLVQAQREGLRHALDFACGTGRITLLNETIMERSTGIDVSADMLRVAAARCQRSRLIRIDLTRDPLPNYIPKADLCTAFRFFLNAEPSLREEALRAIHQSLNPGGLLIANFHCAPNSVMGMLYRLRNLYTSSQSVATIGSAEAQRLVSRNSFSVEAVHHYGLWPRFGWHANCLNGLLLHRMEPLHHRIPALRHLCQSFVVVARRSE
jgi:SAM-dependent methyltransferase